MFKKFGEEDQAELVAKLIIRERNKKPIKTAKDLKDIIFTHFHQNHDRKYKILMRVAQALRIAVNDEFGNLEKLMDQTYENLTEGGIGIIISFHSLEQQIISTKMNALVCLVR
jgi:16S rRNA (cytosine1402-N4)-methyltransferase